MDAGIHPRLNMNEKVSSRILREFGFIVGIGLPLIFGWLIPLLSGHAFRIWTIWIGIPIVIIGVINPSSLRILYRGWMFLGSSLGWLNSRIILGLIFLLVLQPIAFLMRIFGYDPLGMKKSNSLSYKDKRKNFNVDLTRIF